MGCCSCMPKVFLVVFNVVFFLAGCVPLVFGSIALANQALLEDILDAIPGFDDLIEIVDVQEFFQSFAVAFIILGSIIVVIGFAGCCGAIFNSKCLLGVYLTVVILIILAEVAVIIIAAFFPETFSEAGEALMENSFKDIEECTKNNSSEITCGNTESTAWNAMQFSLKCCGYSGISNYEDTSKWTPRSEGVLAPATCCKGAWGTINDPKYDEEFMLCYKDGKNGTENLYYTEGCFDVLIDEALSSAIVIGVLAGIGALEIILVIATIIALCKKSKVTAA